MVTNPTLEVRSADLEFRNHYRYPAGSVGVHVSLGSAPRGFFRFGSSIGFGHCADGVTSDPADAKLPIVKTARPDDSGQLALPFDPNEVADNLRWERYYSSSSSQDSGILNAKWIRNAYYTVRKFLPVHVRKYLQRARLADWDRIPFPSWPVDVSVDLMFEEMMRLALHARGGSPIPFIWFWPHGHSGAMILTHDIEEAAGRDFCPILMDLVETAGFRSSFQIIPEERYEVTAHFLDTLRKRGHEVNVHDLNHDGHLFRERTEFLRRAARISQYLQEFRADGFRSAILYRNPDWINDLGCAYDMSIPNVAHLDPQRGGCCTTFPYFLGDVVELPLTTTQDYSLFHILQKHTLDLWEQQMNVILQRHGLISFNIHPDYIVRRQNRSVFVALLASMAAHRQRHNLWAALPGEVNKWWRMRAKMEIVTDGGRLSITGHGAEQAQLAYAALEGDRLVYRLTNQ
jgi:hypothetical protein